MGSYQQWPTWKSCACLATAGQDAQGTKIHPLLVDGVPLEQSASLGLALNRGPRDTIHSVASSVIPWKGYISPQSYYVRAGTTDRHIIAAINDQHEFSFLEELFAGMWSDGRVLLDVVDECMEARCVSPHRLFCGTIVGVRVAVSRREIMMR